MYDTEICVSIRPKSIQVDVPQTIQTSFDYILIKIGELKMAKDMILLDQWENFKLHLYPTFTASWQF